MSKDRKKVVHIHSNVNDKQPTPATLELGELGVNNAAGNAFISTKNSNNEVVRFSEDGTIVNWMEYKEVIPYEAYVRGSDSATTDVTADDLANNKSNIVIKLNQVVARNTEYDEKVNGAKDIYGNEINPISADGYKDGAGLAINMSRYAMIGANPSFSSVTTTCGAELQGKTSVKGSTCGSELDVDVNTIKENATTIDTTACTRNYNNTNDFKVIECTEGQGETQIKSCKKFNVKSNDIVLEQCGSNGETRIKSCSAVTLQSKNIIMTDTDCGNGEATFDINDLCLVGRTKVNVYGSETNVGIDCDDNPVANNTNVYGKEILISASTSSIIETAKNDVCITAGDIASIYGETNTKIGVPCNGSAKTPNLTIGGNVICVDGDDRANVYGANKSDLGINCGDNDRSTVTRVHGDTVNVTGGTVNVNSEAAINTTATTNINETAVNINENASGNITNIATGNIIETASNGNIAESAINGNISENAANISENASNDITTTANKNITVTAGSNLCEKGENSYFYGTKVTHIGQGCDGTKSSDSIIYERIPSTSACGIKASTVDGALDEVLDRSKIHYSKTEGAHSTTHVIWQDSGACENKIEFSAKETVVSMSSTTEPSGSEILKTYTLWQTIGETVVPIGDINIPKDHLLNDVSLVWGKVYDSGQGFQPCTGSGDQDCHWVIKMVWNVFDPTTGYANNKTLYIDVNDLVQDTDVQSTDGVTMTRWYDGKKNMISANTSVQVVTPDGTVTFTKANGLHSINAYKIAVNKGDVKSELSSIEFNPFNSDKSVTIPTDAKHIWRKTLKVNYGAVCNKADGSETYDPGDGRVNEDREGVITVPNKLSHLGYNRLNIAYGSVQDRQAQSYDPESLGCTVGASTITIPSCVSDLNREKISFQYGQTVTGESGTKTYDPGASCTNGVSETIKIPTCVQHLNRDKMNIHYGGDVTSERDSVYDPGELCSNTASKTIKIPNKIADIGRGKLNFIHNETTVTFDPAADTTTTLAHKTLTINSASGTKTYNTTENVEISLPQCVGEINREKLEILPGSVKDFSGQTYDPGASCLNTASTINMPTCVSHLNRETLTFQAGNVADFASKEYDPGASCSGNTTSINIPNSVSHLNRGTLTYTHNGFSGTFDPSVDTVFSSPHSALTISYGQTCGVSSSGISYNTSADASIVVPKTISDVTGGKIEADCDSGCVSINGDVCVNGVVKANALYSTSDKNLKENIKAIPYEDYHKVSSISLKSFNFKDDETKTKTYGVIAQDLQAVGLDNIVHKDENNNLSVDYTSLLILKIADLENTIKNLSEEIKNLKGVEDKK